MRSGLSSFSFLGLAIAATLMLLFGRETLPGAIAAGVGVGLMVLFIALEFRAAKPVQMWTSAGLLAVGLLLIVVASSGSLEGLGLIYKGLVQNLQYLLLFASIVWLQVQATQSPSLLELRERAMSMPGGSRSVSIMGVAFALGSSFNIAALGLMVPLFGPDTPLPLRQRLMQAVSKGFMIATAWSPVFVGTAVILASLEGVSWVDVGLGGLVLALLLLAAQWGFDGIYRRMDPAAAAARKILLEREHIELRLGLVAVLLRSVAIVLSLFAALAFAVSVFGLSIPVALAFSAPVFGLIWAFLIRREVGPAGADGPVASVGKVLRHYPTLRGETLLFAAANIFGVGIQAMLAQMLGQEGQSLAAVLGWSEPVLLVAAILGFFLICVLGLHPLVSVILLTTLFSAQDLGLAPWSFAVMMMALWGTSTNASPVSATSIVLSRMAEISNFTVAWRVNLPFSLVNLVVILAVFLGLQAWG